MTGVSIILPTYNRMGTLKRAVTSIMAQTHDDWELILVDDGSADQTPQYAEHLKTVLKDRLVFVRQDNAGAAAARNTGAARARKPYLAFMDSDDVWVVEKLSFQLDAMLMAGAEFSYTGSFIFDDNGAAPRRGRFPDDLPARMYPAILDMKHNFVMTSSVVMSRALFSEAGGFDVQMAICEDIDLWARVAMKARMAAVDVDLVGIHIRKEDKTNYAKNIRGRQVLNTKALETYGGIDGEFLRSVYFDLFTIYIEVSEFRKDHDIGLELVSTAAALAACNPDPASVNMIVASATGRLALLEAARDRATNAI